MSQIIRRRDLLRVGAFFGAALAARGATACEAFASTLRVTHPWTRASRQGATTAAVCLMIDQVIQDDRLIGLTTPIAQRAELAGEGVGPALDLVIPQGAEIYFEESATHIRLVDLNEPLLIGRSYPLRLEFERGGLVVTSLSVDQLPLRLRE